MTTSSLLAAIVLYVSSCHPVVTACKWTDDTVAASTAYYQCMITLAQQKDACKGADAALVKISQTK